MTDWTINGRKVIFRHYRNYVEEGTATGDHKLLPCGGGTYAIITNEDGSEGDLGAWAHCNPKDHYNKQVGRLVAFGRLKKLVDAFVP